MATKAEITRAARRLSAGALKDKVETATRDCALHTSRLAQLMAAPQLYEAEIAATTRARDQACAWSSLGSAELGRRQMAAATQAAAAGRQTAAATQAARRRTAQTAPAEEPAPPEFEAPAEPSVWPWVAGAATVGLGALAILGLRKPAVVRYVKALPRKLKR